MCGDMLEIYCGDHLLNINKYWTIMLCTCNAYIVKVSYTQILLGKQWRECLADLTNKI